MGKVRKVLLAIDINSTQSTTGTGPVHIVKKTSNKITICCASLDAQSEMNEHCAVIKVLL